MYGTKTSSAPPPQGQRCVGHAPNLRATPSFSTFFIVASLLLALLALCLVLMTTICSASYMKEQVNRSDFSEAAYSYLYDNFISYGASSGFSADVMTAALSRDQITADMADSITRLYQGDTAIDTRNAILNTTYDNLINDLNSRGVEVTSDVESAVVVVADACRLDYANYVTVPLASQLYTFIEKCSRVVPVAVAKIQRDATEESVKSSFRKLYKTMQEKVTAMTAAQGDLTQAQKTFAVSELQYKRGMISRLKYEEAQDTYMTAQETAENARTDLLTAYNNYEWATRGVMSSAN